MSSVFDADKIKGYGFPYDYRKVKIRLKSFKEMISNDFFFLPPFTVAISDVLQVRSRVSFLVFCIRIL